MVFPLVGLLQISASDHPTENDQIKIPYIQSWHLSAMTLEGAARKLPSAIKLGFSINFDHLNVYLKFAYHLWNLHSIRIYSETSDWPDRRQTKELRSIESCAKFTAAIAQLARPWDTCPSAHLVIHLSESCEQCAGSAAKIYFNSLVIAKEKKKRRWFAPVGKYASGIGSIFKRSEWKVSQTKALDIVLVLVCQPVPPFGRHAVSCLLARLGAKYPFGIM